MPFPNKATQFKKGSARAVQSGRKGGKTVTSKQSLSQRKRWLIKKGHTKEGAQELIDFVKDHEVFALDILSGLMKAEKECTKPHELINLAHAKNTTYKLIHGEKIKTENIHHVVDWSKMFREVLDGDRSRINEDNQETV